ATWEHTLADWQWLLGVNLWGVVHGVRVFVPLMLKQGGEGHIVNTGSVAGLTSNPFMSIYNVSKHAVVALSETLQKELTLLDTEVRVSVLCRATSTPASSIRSATGPLPCRTRCRPNGIRPSRRWRARPSPPGSRPPRWRPRCSTPSRLGASTC